jgi:hypothetical protein
MEAELVTPTEAPLEAVDRQEELFTRLDGLAANLSKASLEYGWTASELWNAVMEDFVEQAGGKVKKALGEFITVVQQRESKDIDKRSTVAERLRIAGYIPRTMYEDIVAASEGYKPTFHQIRGCVITNGLELDQVKTSAMLDWCVSHKWPPVTDIRIQRGILDPKAAVDPAERHFKIFVKLSQAIMAETDPSSERYVVAKTVLDLWTKENNLSASK